MCGFWGRKHCLFLGFWFVACRFRSVLLLCRENAPPNELRCLYFSFSSLNFAALYADPVLVVATCLCTWIVAVCRLGSLNCVRM